MGLPELDKKRRANVEMYSDLLRRTKREMYPPLSTICGNTIVPRVGEANASMDGMRDMMSCLDPSLRYRALIPVISGPDSD